MNSTNMALDTSGFYSYSWIWWNFFGYWIVLFLIEARFRIELRFTSGYSEMS